MKTKLNLLATGILLAALGTGFGQPVITQQPQSCTNAVGTTATFWVVATGAEPPTCQWQQLRACLKTRESAIKPQILLYFFDHLPQQTGDAIHS